MPFVTLVSLVLLGGVVGLLLLQHLDAAGVVRGHLAGGSRPAPSTAREQTLQMELDGAARPAARGRAGPADGHGHARRRRRSCGSPTARSLGSAARPADPRTTRCGCCRAGPEEARRARPRPRSSSTVAGRRRARPHGDHGAASTGDGTAATVGSSHAVTPATTDAPAADDRETRSTRRTAVAARPRPRRAPARQPARVAAAPAPGRASW